MNEKMAKKMRREARNVTIGKPERQYIGGTPSGKTNGFTLRVNPTTTRGVYRAMKRAARRNPHMFRAPG